MTRKQVWKAVGDAFSTPEIDRTEEQGDIANYQGICDALATLMYSGCITMSDRVKYLHHLSMVKNNGDYWLPNFEVEDDYIRATFYYFLASLSDKEYNELFEEEK